MSRTPENPEDRFEAVPLDRLPMPELLRRFDNAVASHEIEGFTFAKADRAFFAQMIAEGLSEEQMMERVRARHGVGQPLAAE